MNESLSVAYRLRVFNASRGGRQLATATNGVFNGLNGARSKYVHVPAVGAFSSAKATRFIHIFYQIFK